MNAALGLLEQSLRSHPEHPDLLHLAGQVALMRGDQTGGRALVERAVQAAPDMALYRITLGNVYTVDDRLDDALAQFRRALRINPRLFDAHTNIGIVLARMDRQQEARAAFANAVQLQPRSVAAQMNLAICCVELRQPEEAEKAVHAVELLVESPEPALLHQIGNIYRGLGRYLTAQGYYERALAQQSDNAMVWFALGDVLSRSGAYEQAGRALQRAGECGYPPGSLHLAEARLASNRGDLVLAKRLLNEASAHEHDDPAQLLRIANLYSMVGDFAAQQGCLARVLEIDPENVHAYSQLAFVPGRALSERDVQRLCVVAEDAAMDSENRSAIGFALGNHFRHAKRYDESFRYYQLGNRLKGYRFDRRAYARWIDALAQQFTREFFAERASWGSASTLPVLIVGMPRSGTTLTEQILSSHPQVYGAGEYGSVAALAAVEGRAEPNLRRNPAQVAQLTQADVAAHADAYLQTMQALATQGEMHVTNKLPHNFEHLGLFGLLFPRAPVIHIRRDPRDNLLSIFFQDFAGIHDYAYDLKTLGSYYRLYERLMAHWLAVIPNPVYSLSYEELVADLPGKSRELADFVGLPWEESMLRFYEQERMVQTASKWQVRQKLYDTSVGRWRPYAAHLQPLFDALQMNV